MAKESFIAVLIVQEYKAIREKYCADCLYLKNGKCIEKKDCKKCLRTHKKVVGGNKNES